MNKPMDEKDKRFRDAQQGQENKRGGQQGGDGSGFKPQQDHRQPGQGKQGGRQGGEGGGFKKK